MSVKVRPHGQKKWMVDIHYETANGERRRERKVPEGVTSRTAAERWAGDRLRVLLAGEVVERKEVPTLADFQTRFVRDYAKANQQKHSSIVTKESIFKVHLVPAFGSKRLDEITTADVDALKGKLTELGRSPKRINDVLTVLRTALSVAADWDVMPPTRAKIRGLKVPEGEMSFYDDAELGRLLVAAKSLDPRFGLAVLLGADAGLRAGEMISLEWQDCDVTAGLITVRRTEWRGKVASTKGWKPRTLEMTSRLRAALVAFRHLRGVRVFYRPDNRTVTLKILQGWLQSSLRVAGFAKASPVHALRHTFGTRLAAKGVTAKQIQELMGHRDVETTKRYLHFVPGARAAAMRLLENTGNVASTEAAEKASP